MKLKPIASNMTELHDNKGNVILFSYETPVAAFIQGQGYIKTAVHYSSTTTRHITKWLELMGLERSQHKANVREVTQETINTLVK